MCEGLGREECDTVITKSRRVTCLGRDCRIAGQQYGPPEVKGHDFKGRPFSTVMCFSPATFGSWSTGVG